tara:strand:- start:433 stop:843 length:411 start_codon:yes stop_codon:yes gene_type:complete
MSEQTNSNITKMNRANVNLIADEAGEALKAVAEKYGLILKPGRGAFDPSAGTFTPKFTFICETEDGVPADFARLAPRYDLTVEDYGREFTTYAGTYRLTGINPRRRKYPISGTCVRSGKGYKFPLKAVKFNDQGEA